MKRFLSFDGNGRDLINSTLRTIELNITTLCNRSCSFCPHSWGFKKHKKEKHLSLETLDRFIELLDNYDNQITLCGQGEPTMHPDIKEILDRLQVLDNKIILVTNSYKLSEVVDHLGKIEVRVSLYEPTELPDIPNMKIIDYYNDGQNEYFNNRSYTEGISKCCYIPSYKMFVDTNGGVLPCDNNWTTTDYFANIHDDDLETIWLEKLHPLRTNCLSNRLENDHCKNCDSHGTLYGKTEADLLTTNLP